jgi:hypothetical protein
VKIHPLDCLLCCWVRNRVVPYRFSEAHADSILRVESAPQYAGVGSSKTSGPNSYASSGRTRWEKKSGSLGTTTLAVQHGLVLRPFALISLTNLHHFLICALSFSVQPHLAGLLAFIKGRLREYFLPFFRNQLGRKTRIRCNM